MKSFREYEEEASDWITFVENDYYPDYLEPAKEKYKEDIKKFGDLLEEADDSADVLKTINEEWNTGKERTQLLRIFRRYVSPDTPVEMLKTKSKEDMIVEDFGHKFRNIEIAKSKFENRPSPDETLSALLDQHSDRGQKGYWVEEQVFTWFEENFGKNYKIRGPRGPGRDIYLDTVFDGYSKSTPVDFVVYDLNDEPQLVGLARYDSDRGGAQEDDRTGGNTNTVKDITKYSKQEGLDIKILFVNDGPGLIPGSMWEDYSTIEESAENVRVCTLKMLDERITESWLISDPVTESEEEPVNEDKLEKVENEDEQDTESADEGQSGLDQFDNE